MRFSQIQYLEKEQVTVSIRNNNASLAILDGMPVFFDGNNVASVNLGTDVKTASTTASISFPANIAGIAKSQKAAGLAVGDTSEAVCYGFTDSVVVRRTRAATSDSWDTSPAIRVFDQLVVESVNNYLTVSASLAAGATPAGIFAGESFASSATLASATASSNATMSAFSAATAQTTRMKVFVRLM